MEKEELDIKIEDAAKMIMSFSRSRTRNDFDAEDLAQDIVCELYRSRTNIKSDGAFYGFMWSVAEASLPAVEICSDIWAAGMSCSAMDTR